QVIIDKYELECDSNDVKMYPGAIKHIQRKHPGIYERYSGNIKDIIENPDYVGNNPKEPNSVELIKVIDEHILIAIKLDPSGYLFLSSMYDMNNGPVKVEKRLKSGRLQPYMDLIG
ncbi:PBECR2 nuclease fold domain-containing protein, partial [Bacillus thuringiensis]